jgi:ribosome biogenesis protein BMS1
VAVQVEEMDAMPDPCPLPSMLKKRGLNEKERLLYAPMSDVGGLLYDKDAVYIDVPGWKVGTLPSPVALLPP